MAKARKSKFVTAVLAFFGGWLGLHRFYLGDHQAGFVFIFLTVFLSAFTIPVTTIMGVFEALRFFSMGQSEFDRKYNKHMTNTYSQDYRKQRSGKREKTVRPPTNYKKRENPYKKTGFKKYDESDIEGAIDDLEEALKIDSTDKSIYFRLACAYSLMEEPQESLNYLNEAIRQGYKDFNTINSIDDLAFLRISPMFQAYKAQGYSANPQAQIASPRKKDLLQDDLLLSQLKKLAELRERGLLSETDYQIEKQKLRTRKG